MARVSTRAAHTLQTWRRNQKANGTQRHQDTQDAQETQETPRRPRRHPGGTHEAPRGVKSTREAFQVKCAKTIVFYTKNDVGDHFCVDGSDVTLTKPAACAQK